MKLKRLYWRQEETKYFLTLCVKRNIMGKFGLHRKDDIFEMLSKDMRDVGFIKNAAQCKTKLKHLKEDFNRRRKITPYVDEMEKLLASHIKKKSKTSTEPITVESIKCVTLDPSKPIVNPNTSVWNEINYSTTSNDRFDISSSSIENTTIKTEIIEDNITNVWNDSELDNMDISEVTEYSRTSDANKTLLAEPPSQPKNESELFVDNSNSNITHTQCLPSSSNLGTNSNSIPKKVTNNSENQHFVNYLIKNQQKFIHDILETQKKWNMDIIDKIHEHQSAQLKIIFDGFSEEVNTQNQIKLEFISKT